MTLVGGEGLYRDGRFGRFDYDARRARTSRLSAS